MSAHRAPLCTALLLTLATTAVLAQEATRPATIASGVEVIPREALFGNPERANVQISPDGKYLSWVAPVGGVPNVWIAPASDPAKAKAITDDKARGIRQYFWSYRPDTLLYLRDTGGDEDFHVYRVDLKSGGKRDLSPFPKTRARVGGVSHLHPDAVLIGMNDRDPKWHDLYRVDLASGERTLIEKNMQGFAGYLADAEFKPRLALKTRSDGGQDLLEPDGRGGWKKTGDIPFEDSLTTQPGGYTTDGRTLYYADSRGRDTAGLYAVDVASGKKTLLLDDQRVDIGATLMHPRSGRAQAVAVDYLREQWKPLDPAIAKDLETLAAIGPGNFSVSDRTLDDAVWIVFYTAADAPGTYYRYTRANGKLDKLFDVRPTLAGKPLVPTTPIEIQARDGLTLVSYLTLPKGADTDGDGKPEQPVPMVLNPHGGPWARDSYGYNPTAQWLANRGYAVLKVNFRGSTGFGKSFLNQGNQQWAGKMHEDLIDAVNWAVKQGVTSADQVAIMGGSYGGYATLVGVTFTPDTFRCGVDIVGPSNLNTLLSTIPPYWVSQFEQFANRIGDPRTPDGKKLLAERSPLTRVDSIERPLLIGQGANDPRVKQAESDQIVQAMQNKKIPVTYVLFPDEGHGFARSENNTAFNAVTEGFLGECLGGRMQPIGTDFEGSSISVPVGADGVPGLAEALKTHTQVVHK